MDDLLKSDSAQSLIDAARSGDVTIVVGAGVSTSRGVPSWQALAEGVWKRVMRTRYPFRGKSAHSHPFAHQFAFELIEAELLQQNSNSGYANFVEAIRSVLYEGIETPQLGQDGDTLCTLGRLLRRESRRGASRQIRRVISFNVDDLLEKEVHRRGDLPAVWPISRASDDALRAPTAIPVYHLHGYIPSSRPRPWKKKTAKRPTSRRTEGIETTGAIRKKRRQMPVMRKGPYHQLYDVAADTFVFTDWQYWRLSSTPFSFANRVFGSALQESRCIFVGLSMTDVNLIRWLGLRSVELVNDLTSEFSLGLSSNDAPPIEFRGYRAPHFWIRSPSADPHGVISKLLQLRGVRTIEIDSWTSGEFKKLMNRCFPKARKGVS